MKLLRFVPRPPIEARAPELPASWLPFARPSVTPPAGPTLTIQLDADRILEALRRRRRAREAPED